VANSELVKMGVCNVTFDGTDLGYTKGFVKVTYSSETLEKTVDQLDTPISEIITKQVLEVEVPMAEKNLQVLANLLPGATLKTGVGVDAGKHSLELSGVAGGDLGTLGGKLVCKPIGGTEEDWLTVFKAVPIPSFDMTYDKENVQVFKFKFKAVPDVSGKWALFGDESLVIA